MNNAEIREANWPKLKSALEHQMMLCTSNLEQVQVRPFRGLVTAQMGHSGAVRCMHHATDMIAYRRTFCARPRSAEHGVPTYNKSQTSSGKCPPTLEHAFTSAADMLRVSKPSPARFTAHGSSPMSVRSYEAAASQLHQLVSCLAVPGPETVN